MNSVATQLTEQELNLEWVFGQLLALTADGSSKKRNSLGSELDPSSQPALTIAHIKHVFDWMKVPLTNDEADEVLSLMDDNEDGRVTLDDFWHTMKVTPSTPFDARYAVNLPFSSLDSSTKDGVLTDEDYRHARADLGKMFGCDNDLEYNMVMRAMQAAGCGPTMDHAGMTPGPGVSPSVRKQQFHLDKDAFRKVVGTARTADSPGSSHAASPVLIPRTLHPSGSHSNLVDQPSSMVISLIPASPSLSGLSASAGPPGLELKLDPPSTPSVTFDNLPPSTSSQSSSFTPQQPQSARPAVVRRQSRPAVQPQTTTNARQKSSTNLLRMPSKK